jgi:Peptidase family M1 domain
MHPAGLCGLWWRDSPTLLVLFSKSSLNFTLWHKGMFMKELAVLFASLAAMTAAQALAAAPLPPATTSANPAAAEIPFVSPNAAAATVASAPGAWGGARSGNEQTLSDRVVAYRIDAKLDPVAHTVEGQEKLTWRNRSDRPIKVIYLHMYLNSLESRGSTFLSEEQRRGFNWRDGGMRIGTGEWGHIELRSISQSGQPAQVSYVHPDGGPDTDHTVMRVDLPTAVPPLGSTTLDINFLDQLPRIVARTGYFGSFHLIGQWYPKIGVLELPGERGATEVRWNVHEFHVHSEFYADFGSFDVHLTVPKGYVVGATGEEIDTPLQEGTAVTHHFVQDDVHDFAWTADNRTAPPLEATYQGPGSPTVKIKVLFPPEYASDAAPAMQATEESLAYFSRTLGPYPYKTVTVVIPPYNAGSAGAMEYPTFFTTIHVKDPDPGTFDALGLEEMTIHEFGHGYFYGIVGSNEFEEPMLDEGLNKYWDRRMIDARYRAKHEDLRVTTTWLRRIGIAPRLTTDLEFDLGPALVENPVDGVGENSWNRLSSPSYFSTYGRTAYIMHDLEQRLGTPVMEQAMRAYYQRWKFRHPSIADFRESLAESSGQRAAIEAAFDQQVYAAAKIDDSIDGLESDEVLPQAGTRFVDGKWVEQTQADVAADIKKQRADKIAPFAYRTTVTLGRAGAAVPETVVVHFADGTSETAEWNDTRRWQRYTWVKPSRAVYAELDPAKTHLLDANRINNSRITDAEVGANSPDVPPSFLQRMLAMIVGGPASRRFGADFEAVMQSALTLMSTL